jgi:AcrR family transcriptional regulator
MSRPKNKEEAIVSAAITVFMEKGFSNASIKDIAISAGVGKGTVYEYFKNKDDLFIQSANYGANQRFLQVRNIIVSNKGFIDKLNDLIYDAQEAAEDSIDWFEFFVINGYAGLSAEAKVGFQSLLHSLMSKMVEIYSELLAQGIAEGIIKEQDLRFTSSVIFELIAGYSRQFYHKDWSNEQRQEERSKLVNFIMNGIGVEL